MKYKVLCLHDVRAFPEVLDALGEIAEVKVFPPEPGVLLREIVDCDAYIASLHVRLTAEAIAASERLRVIATPSTGLDHIDLDAAEARGIPVLSLKDDRTFLDQITCTAELTWGLLLACVRRIPAGFNAARQGRWARDAFRGHQLAGKTFGILGYGRLGTMMGDYAGAFRMRVLACDVRDFDAPGIERVDMDTLFRESDVVSIHVHLTPENRGLVGRKQIEMMKPGAILLNSSRGAVIDEAALLDALEAGRLGGAGLDVIHGEWSDDLYNHPLITYAREHENLIISPHLGGVTYESQAMAMRYTAEKLRDFLAGDKKSPER